MFKSSSVQLLPAVPGGFASLPSMSSFLQRPATAAQLDFEQRCRGGPTRAPTVLEQRQPRYSCDKGQEGGEGGVGSCALTEARVDDDAGQSDAAGGGDPQRFPAQLAPPGLWQSADGLRGGVASLRQQAAGSLVGSQPIACATAAAAAAASQALAQPPAPAAGEQLRYRPAAALAAMTVRGWGVQQHIKGALRRAPRSEVFPTQRLPHDSEAAFSSDASEGHFPPAAQLPRRARDGGAWRDLEGGNPGPGRSPEAAHWHVPSPPPPPPARKRGAPPAAAAARRRQSGGGVSDMRDVVLVARARPPPASPAAASLRPAPPPSPGSPSRGEPAAAPPPSGPTPPSLHSHPRHAQFEQQLDRLLAEVATAARASAPAPATGATPAAPAAPVAPAQAAAGLMAAPQAEPGDDGPVTEADRLG